eukprot:4045015-Pleurochrysis_carterae.AAC.6
MLKVLNTVTDCTWLGEYDKYVTSYNGDVICQTIALCHSLQGALLFRPEGANVRGRPPAVGFKFARRGTMENHLDG